MDATRSGENNVPPLAKKLYRVGSATGATAVGGLMKKLVAASVGSRQAEDVVPLSLPALFFLLLTLFGGLTTVYAGRRLELELTPTPRWHKAGVAVYFLCLLLLVAAVSLVGSDYCKLALNFIGD